MTRSVLASFDETDNPRLRELLTGIVGRAHEFVADYDVTATEWRSAIDFLTQTGQLSSATREEFVIVSDVLGISTMVDVLANSRSVRQTPPAVLGPFYLDDAPELQSGADLAAGQRGAPMWAQLAVCDTDDTPISDAVVDAWQANADGCYDVQLPELGEPALRGRFRTDVAGRVAFWSMLPREYPVPNDGTAAQLLSAVGRHPYRAPHVHFMIRAPGYHTLVTQLFVAGGAYLDSDAVFAVKAPMVVDIPAHDGPTPDGRELESAWHLLEYTFRLTPRKQGA